MGGTGSGRHCQPHAQPAATHPASHTPRQPSSHLLVNLPSRRRVLSGHNEAVPRHQPASSGQRKVAGLADGDGQVAGAVGGGKTQAALVLQPEQGKKWEAAL